MKNIKKKQHQLHDVNEHFVDLYIDHLFLQLSRR